jgi:hypothetical protein
LIIGLDLVEGFADLAVVGSVGVVDAEHVLLEVGQLRERLLAKLTHVRLLAGVHPKVKFQRGGVRKRPVNINTCYSGRRLMGSLWARP